MDLMAQKEDSFGQVEYMCMDLVLCSTVTEYYSVHPLCDHSLGEQSLMSVSQFSPLYPDRQEHRKPPGVLVQVPRFLQGFEMHSFTSTLHS